jgi:hypothetical protein
MHSFSISHFLSSLCYGTGTDVEADAGSDVGAGAGIMLLI